MNNITPQDMMNLQTDNYNVFAEMALPILLRNIRTNQLNESEKKYLEILKSWNLRNDADSRGATIFVVTWDSLESVVWSDEFAKSGLKLPWPNESTLLDQIRKDPSFKFLDNINTPTIERLPDDVTISFKKAVATITIADKDKKMEWAKYKDTRVLHLLRLDAFSRMHLPVGGGNNIINAVKAQHGPSWRMVVSLTPQTEAYGVYPGGQSGNPGSKYYDNFVDQWVEGKYYPLWVMNTSDTSNKRIKWKMRFFKN